jgi:hypothetical protein
MIFKWFNNLDEEDEREPEIYLYLFPQILMFGFLINVMIYTENPLKFIGFIIASVVLTILLYLCEYRKVAIRLSILIILSIDLVYFNDAFKLWLIPIFLILIEIFFLLDKEKPLKKGNKFNFTIKKKLEAGLESIITMMGGIFIYGILNKSIPKILIWSNENKEIIINWIGYIGIGIVIIIGALIVLWAWIKVNSLKYEK